MEKIIRQYAKKILGMTQSTTTGLTYCPAIHRAPEIRQEKYHFHRMVQRLTTLRALYDLLEWPSNMAASDPSIADEFSIH